MKEKIKNISKKNIANVVGGRILSDSYIDENAKTTSEQHLNLTSNYNGITLIALIITIIVMLILVGITISIALNGGLIAKAQNAKSKTEEAMRNEQNIGAGRIKVDGTWYNSIDEYVKGIPSDDQNNEPPKWRQDKNGNITYEGEPSGLKIGDYVDYTYDVVESGYELPQLITGFSSADRTCYQVPDLSWRVLGVDQNGCLTLISDKLAKTSAVIGLEGARGYNNGVFLLNDMCAKFYSNAKMGITARSVTIEDVETGFSDLGKQKRDEYTHEIRYGDAKTYYSNLNYPVLYAEEDGSGIGSNKVKDNAVGRSEPYYGEDELINKENGKERDTATGMLTCKQTFYTISPDPDKDCKSKDFHDLVFGTGGSYWLASRCVDCFEDAAGFGLFYVDGRKLTYKYMFSSGSSGVTIYRILSSSRSFSGS